MRRDPYLLFFPIGIALAWAGISHWFLHAVGVLEDFRPIFHAITQVESFLTAFALGFMFTMIPRRTESAPPASWQLAVGAISTVGISISAWFGKTAFSQVFWIALCLMMLGFVIPRFRARPGKRSPPNSFVWIPIAFVIGIIGSVLTGVGAALGTDYWWLHDLGRGLILQGVFVSLILGIGGLVLPFMTRGEKPKDGGSLPPDRRVRMLHVLAALGLAGTFAIAQFVSLRGALFLRAAIIFAVLVLSADLLSPPKGPGLNRRLMRLAVWMVPLGYVVAGTFDTHWKAGLHVTFIGGFSLLTFAVSTQVSLGHGGLGDRLKKWPAAMIICAVSALAAIVPRGLMGLDPDRYFTWMGVAAALFLIATLSWTALVVPGLRRSISTASQ